MIVIAFSFVLMTALTFGVLMFSMRLSPDQKAIDKRMFDIKLAQGQAASEANGLLLAGPDAGPFAFVDSLLRRYKVSAGLQRLILQSNVPLTIGKLLFFCAACGAGLFVVSYVIKDMLLLSLVAGLQGFFWPILYLRWKRSRKLAAFDAGLADSIDMMARSLRAGHAVAAAVGIVAEQAVEPVKSEFSEVFRKQNYGLPLRDALMQLLDRVPSQDLRVLVTGMLVQKESGGNLAEILDRICFVIRERIRIKGEIRTHTAQGRLTGWILCLLPIVMLVLINWINPGYSNVLFDTSTGHKLLFLGLGLLVCGGLVIRQIINGIEV